MSKTHRFIAFFIALGLCVIAPLASSQTADSDDRRFTNFWLPGDPGERLLIEGRVLDEAGKGIIGATVNIRQTDGNGEYTARYSGTLTTGQDGVYAFSTVLPGQYYNAKHIHVFVTHDNYLTLQTRILFKLDQNHAEEIVNKHAISLETAQVKGEKVFIGKFDMVLKTSSQ